MGGTFFKEEFTPPEPELDLIGMEDETSQQVFVSINEMQDQIIEEFI
jgi:hypothetical protein